MTVILVHGFNVWDGGKDTVGRLRPYFEAMGCEVQVFKYRWMGLLLARLRNRGLAEKLAGWIADAEPPVTVVGHSNGFTLTHLAGSEFGAKIDCAVGINPALDRDEKRPKGTRKRHVWHSPSDWPSKFSRFLFSHPWGAMGALGFQGRDRRTRNFNKERDFEIVSEEHSDVFEKGKIEFFGPLIANEAVKEVS